MTLKTSSKSVTNQKWRDVDERRHHTDYILGRVEDYIITPEGRFVGRLDHIFKDAKYVKNSQIVQNDLSQVVIRIEKENKYSKKVEDKILKEARSRLERHHRYKISVC